MVQNTLDQSDRRIFRAMKWSYYEVLSFRLSVGFLRNLKEKNSNIFDWN